MSDPLQPFELHLGDCREVLERLPEASVDAIVCDPPYDLTRGSSKGGFMGKQWDSTGVAFDPATWKQVFRVLKPGGHLLAFGGARTYHRLACAIEDAGFEIRDQVQWVYGTGFPKSLDVGKAIDKASGAEREVVSRNPNSRENCDITNSLYEPGTVGKTAYLTTPATEEARQWDGWGTALKPAHEPIVLARKPFKGTVAGNVLKHGTGALNIDGCRVGSGTGEVRTYEVSDIRGGNYGQDIERYADRKKLTYSTVDKGRWPSNFIHDGSQMVLELFPDTGKSTGGRIGKKAQSTVANVPAGRYEAGDPGYGDSGSAARFFYCPKANARDRDEGLGESFTERKADLRTDTAAGLWAQMNAPHRNNHPTVKPTDLMRYLCRLITPPNGVVLDPFMGSGSTGKAAVLEGFRFIGIEQEAEYLSIALARINYALEGQTE